MTALGGIVDIFSEIKEYGDDALLSAKAIKQMQEAFGQMDVKDAIKAFRGLGVEGDDLVEILLNCGVKSEVIEASLNKTGKSGAKSVAKLKSGFEGLAATIGMTSNGLIKLIGGVSAVAVLGTAFAKMFDYLLKTGERNDEWLSGLKNEYEDATSSLKSYTEELEVGKDRLSELQSLKDLGGITASELEELNNLKETNNELSRKINLLQLEQNIKQKQVNSAFVSVMQGDLNSAHISKDNRSGYDVKIVDGMEVINPIYDNEITYLEKSFDRYKENRRKIAEQEEKYKDLIVDAQAAGDVERANRYLELQKKNTQKYEEENQHILQYLNDKNTEFQKRSDGISWIDSPTTAEERAVNEQLALIDDFADKRAILLGGEGAKTDAFNRLIDKEFNDVTKGLKELGREGAVTAEMLKDPAYSEFVDKCISLGIVSDSSTESLNFLALGFNNLTNAVSGSGVGLSGTTTAIDLINQSIDGVQSKISSLGDSLTKLRDGSITLEEVIDLIQEFPELAEYVDLTSESFGDLDKGLQKLIRRAPDKLIDELQNFKETADLTDKQREAIDGLCASMEKLSTDAIKDASGEFGILAEAINESKRAKSDLDKELAKDDYDANYEDRIEAFKGLQEVMKSGEYGSRAFDAYKNYFDIGELDSDGVKKWIQQNNKYFSDGKQGVANFLKEIERLNNTGLLDESIASYDSITKTFAYDITQIEAIGEAFGWSGEMVQDFVGKFRMYSEDFIDRTTEITQKELLMRDYIQDFGDVAIVSMEKLQGYTGYTEQGVSDLVDQMNALNTAVESELRALSEGGNVNLNLRPEIDTSELLKEGWAEELVGEAGNIATVFSSTFSNQAGNIAMNFTPIQVDENGNYIGVLDPETFEQYCNDIIDGVREDDLNLKIGATYTGHDAIKQAEMDANRIHELHAMLRASGEIKILGVDDIHITQSIVDSMEEALGSIDEVKSALYDLSNTKGVTFDSGITLNGKSIHDVLAEEKTKAEEAVSVDIKMTVNDQEVLASVTSTAAEMKRILGEDWQVILDSEDVETKGKAIETLLDEITEPATVTVDGKTYNAVNGLKDVLELVKTLKANSVIDIIVNQTSGGSSSKTPTIRKPSSSNGLNQIYAEGTDWAHGGPALLGDEYSPDGSPKPEMVITNGAAYVAGQHGPEVVTLERGDRVLTADQTKKALSGSRLARKSVIPAFAGGKNKELFDNLASSGASYEEMSSSMKDVSIQSGANVTIYTDGNPGGSWGGASGGGSGDGSGGGSGSSSSSGSSTKEKSQFEKDYEAHNHLVAMEKESYEDYLKWLEGAYEDAYNKGEIELEDYRKYMEEVFEGQKELFQDSIEDIEHKIKFLEREPGNEREIITYYNRIITKIDAEIAAARARGLNDDDDYIQELLEQKWDYADEIADIEEEITENAKDAVDELVDYRVDMLKQEIEDHKDALNDKLDVLKDFYDEQKQMLQDSYDEEKYLEEQNEKRRSVSDIKDELDQLRFDNSAAAEKRKLELQEELKAAEKELSDFEKDKALQDAMDLLDKQYEQQEKDIQSQIDELDAKLNDPNALFNQALSDIKHNTAELYGEMVAYNNAHGDGNPETIKEMYDSAKESLDQFLKTFGEAYKDILLVGSSSSAVTGYASGTSHATKGVHELFEGGKDEYVYQTKDGHRYKMFSGLGDKVLNASATDFLYKFANNGEAFMTNMIKSLFGGLSPTSLIRSPGTVSVSTGDIVIQGNADSATVSEIRRAQRENVNHILREFVKLNR